MKKKILKVIIPCFVFLLLGCELNNTPTSKVEEMLSNYQMVSDDISVNEKVAFFSNSDTLTDNQTGEYRKIIEKQYKSLSYDVKDETIDGDEADVEVQIEVLDYKKILEEYNKDASTSTIGVENYHNGLIEELKDASDKVTYTIVFHVIKDDSGSWQLESLDSSEEQKLLGIY